MKGLSLFVERIRDWYRGEYIPPPKPDPDDRVVFVCGHHKQPPLAKVLWAIGRLLAAHGKWLITVLLMALAIVVNILLNCRKATG